MRHAAAKGRREAGPSQRQLRAGELVRHALAEILREEEVSDPALAGVSVTVTEARLSPDLRHALVFVEPLGGGHAGEVVDGLNRSARFLRGRLGHAVELKFIPDLKFAHDESFEEAARIDRLLARPEVARDLERAESPLGASGEALEGAHDPACDAPAGEGRRRAGDGT